MKQMSLLTQYDNDKCALVDLINKFTGINKAKLSRFLNDNPVQMIFERTDVLELSDIQRKKVEDLKLLKSLYSNVKANEKEESYIMNSSSKAGEYFVRYFTNTHDRERFICTFVDAQNRIIKTKTLFEGTLNEAPVYPREIIKDAINYYANSVILSHNHPGGSLKASEADRQATYSIKKALESVSVKLVDHIIVADDKYISFAEEGLLSIDLVPTAKASEQVGKSSKEELSDKQRYSVKDKLLNLKGDIKNKTQSSNQPLKDDIIPR